jgi:UDP-N-acetylglucosamine enolpyruvyl transferase
MEPLMIMITMKSTGSGTVSQTIHEELFTPLNTQRKMMTQHDRQAKRAGIEKTVSSPSFQAKHVSSSRIRMTLIL